MLTHTFCCFDGISGSAERHLWSSGCLEWQELLVLEQRIFSLKRLERLRAQIHQAKCALDAGLADYFLNRLKPPDTIRILPHFLSSAGYLDIETTGLSKTDHITTVTLSSNGKRRCYVRGLNLDDLLSDLPSLSLLITYNGASFDLPRIRKEFRIDLAVPHLDLRPCLNALGYKGGLKSCEAQFDIQRPPSLSPPPRGGVDAIDLWHRYIEHGENASLSLLLRYNLWDVFSLEILAVKIYNLVMASFPNILQIPLPEPFEIEELDLEDVLW